MFLRKIIPQDKAYFELFRRLADCVQTVGETLADRTEKGEPLVGLAEELKRIEHTADEYTHELLRRLEGTFVTPFDREDIHALADRLDEIVDLVEEVGKMAAVYRVERLEPRPLQMARVLARACAQVALAVGALPDAASVLEQTKAIRGTETEGDALYYAALEELFRGHNDPLDVIRWKDLINALENAIDACEHAAGTLEGIALKHA
ncbi:MAG: DUF47 domain-containing protein [Gemmatimonadota bacterium]